MIVRAYKTELKLNNKQRAYLGRCAGAARFVYNWALADRKQRYEDKGENTNIYEQKRRFNALKHAEYPWLAEVPYALVEQAFRNLDTAYNNFFRRVKKGETPGFPKFKSRHKGIGSFTLRGCIHITETHIKLPRLGWLRLKERGYLPTNGTRVLSVNVSEQAGRWYVSVQVEQEHHTPPPSVQAAIGIDLGIKSLAVCSDGRAYENPKALYVAERKMARLQRELSRRKKGSANRNKTKAKIAKLHGQIANIRRFNLHQVSHDVTSEPRPGAIVVEDLNVAGMMKNHCLARATSDSGMSELRRQIEYKAGWQGIEIVTADRWYPSSKTCSECGSIKSDLTLSDRTYHCAECGAVIDRDLNAARNLASLVKDVNRETHGNCLGS